MTLTNIYSLTHFAWLSCFMDCIASPPNSWCWNPNPSSLTFFLETESLQVKMRLLGWTLTQYAWCPHENSTFGERYLPNLENATWMWRQLSQVKEKSLELSLPLWPSEGTNPADTVIFDVWTPEPRDGIFCCLSHPVHGTLLWQP